LRFFENLAKWKIFGVSLRRDILKIVFKFFWRTEDWTSVTEDEILKKGSVQRNSGWAVLKKILNSGIELSKDHLIFFDTVNRNLPRVPRWALINQRSKSYYRNLWAMINPLVNYELILNELSNMWNRKKIFDKLYIETDSPQCEAAHEQFYSLLVQNIDHSIDMGKTLLQLAPILENHQMNSTQKIILFLLNHS